MPIITLVNEERTIEVAEGANLRKILIKNGISPYVGKDKFLNCLGNGFCGTCRVEVMDGKGAPAVSPKEEMALLGITPFFARKIPKNVRLSCQIPVMKDITIRTHPAIEIDRQLTKERLTLAAIWTFFGGIFLVVVIRLLIEIATGV